MAKELEVSGFGIICITRDNVQMPWVLFEAGALAKSLADSRVIPLLLDLDFRDITGPLAQFQAKKVEQSGLEEVIRSINKAAPEPEPEARTTSLFEALWPKFAEKIERIPDDEASARRARPQTEVLEELVASVRSVESRVRDVLEASPRSLERSRRRFHPMMIDELAHVIGDGPDDDLMILVVAGMFRESAPWLYELGVDAYRASSRDKRRAIERFMRAAELLEREPFSAEVLGMDRHEIHMMMRSVRHLRMRYDEPVAAKAARPKRPSSGSSDSA